MLLHEDIKAEFLDRLVEKTAQLRLGSGIEEGTQIGPLINSSQRERVRRYIGLAKDEGAKVLIGGEIPKEEALQYGYFLQPTILDEVTVQMKVAQEEIFGPVVCAIAIKDFEEAIKILNDTSYGLSASLYTRDVNRAFQAMRDIEVGIVHLNSSTIETEVHLPFGGIKHTGNGFREVGSTALDVFTEWKTVYVNFSAGAT